MVLKVTQMLQTAGSSSQKSEPLKLLNIFSKKELDVRFPVGKIEHKEEDSTRRSCYICP
jgi:hypothetical protein